MMGFFSKLFNNDSMAAVDDRKVSKIEQEIRADNTDSVIPRYIFDERYDPMKPTILILDDNEGATMLFEKTIREISEKYKCDVEDIQFVKITTTLAVFMLEQEIKKGTIRNVIGAILDITFGGHAVKGGKLVMYDGIDAYKIIKNRFPNAIIRFYTSHSMNPKNIDVNKFMKKFSTFSGKDIRDFTYIKDPFSNSREEMLLDIIKTYNEQRGLKCSKS